MCFRALTCGQRRGRTGDEFPSFSLGSGVISQNKKLADRWERETRTPEEQHLSLRGGARHVGLRDSAVLTKPRGNTGEAADRRRRRVGEWNRWMEER